MEDVVADGSDIEKVIRIISKFDDLVEEFRRYGRERAATLRRFLAFSEDVPTVVRKKFGKGRGNVAVSKLDADGEVSDIVAISGEVDVDGFAPYIPNDERRLKAGGAGHGRYLRDVDAEAKILEQTLNMTTDDSTGVLRIFTELPMCDGCSALVRNFQRYRLGIAVEVVDGKGGRRLFPARDSL